MSLTDETLSTTLGQRDALERAGMIWTQQAAQTLLDSALENGDAQLVSALKVRAEQYGWLLSEAGNGPETKTARNVLVSLLNTIATTPTLVCSAESFTNPQYSADGLTDERRKRTTAAVAALTEAAKADVAKLQELADKAAAKAQSKMPRLDLNDPAQLTRTAQAWEYTILPVINRDEAINWGSLIGTLDVDGLLALQRFGDQWLGTQKATKVLSSTREQIKEGVAARMPFAVTDPATAALLTNAQQTAAYLEHGKHVVSYLPSVNNLSSADQMTGVVQRASVAAGIQNEIVYPARPFNRL